MIEATVWGIALTVVALAGLISWALNRWLLARATTWLPMDLPNDRSLHEIPTPRGGGIGIAITFFLIAGLAFLAFSQLVEAVNFLGPAAAIALISHLDDRRSLSPLLRLCVQIPAAIWWVWGAGVPASLFLPGLEIALPFWLSATLSVLMLVWLTNLYNFMDGMDGFAAGMGVIGFGALGWLFVAVGQPLFAIIAFAIAGSALGFLRLNFPPARLFMGDVGSSLLGFLAGAMILRGEVSDFIPLWLGVLVFAPFVVDATVTIIRRLLQGERIWQPHRTHYYQRLVQLGWGHRRTVLVEYALMVGCAGCAIAAFGAPVQFQQAVIAVWAVLFTLAIVVVRALERAAQRSESNESAAPGPKGRPTR